MRLPWHTCIYFFNRQKFLVKLFAKVNASVPCVEFGEEGKSFLGKLGIVRIPANDVTLCPFLLGSKFRRIANKAVMRRHGVK